MKTLTVIALLCAALTAQAQITTKHVSVLGNSIAEYERGDEHNIFPLLPVNNIFIHGHPGATCAVVRSLSQSIADGREQLVKRLTRPGHPVREAVNKCGFRFGGHLLCQPKHTRSNP